jgi:hypothetical protein
LRRPIDERLVHGPSFSKLPSTKVGKPQHREDATVAGVYVKGSLKMQRCHAGLTQPQLLVALHNGLFKFFAIDVRRLG